MTPAIVFLNKQKVAFNTHQYEHDVSAASYALEAADKLSVTPARIFKTLIVNLDQQSLGVAILPADAQLSMKKLALALGAKKAAMADPQAAQRATGYVLGGVSPFGQKKRLPVCLDESAFNFESIYVSAGRRGLEVELAPELFAALLASKTANIRQ